MRTFVPALFVLLSAAASATAAPAQQWTEVRSPHFIVLTDSSEKQGRKIAGQFERMRSLFQTALPHAGGDASLPITVVATRDRKGFQSIQPAAYQAKGQLQLAGLFMSTPDRNYILLRLDAENEHPFSVVYHEYTHFILRKDEWLPLWLNEGLAEFYQNTEIEDKEVKLGEPSVDNILYLRQNSLLPLPALFAVDHNSPYYHDEQKGSVFYAESWALVHYLRVTDSQNKTDRVGTYARLLIQHEDPVVAAQHAFGDLGQLQKSLDTYVSHAEYQMFVLNKTFPVDETSFNSRPISLSDANAVRADVLASNDRRAEAQALLDDILKDDPKNALAHETMGSLALRDHDRASAKKWYGEAVELGSQSYLAHFNYAVFSLMDNDAGKDDAIEASLRKAVLLEPDFAPSYDALAHFYCSHHRNLGEAHTLSLQAVELEPEEVGFRINSAEVAMEQENVDNALAILNAARKIAKSDTDIAMIDRQIQQIERHKTELEHAPKGEVDTNGFEDDSSDGAGAPEQPPYPNTPLTGPHHTAKGVLHSVHCGYPTVLTFKIDQAGKPISLYSNDYFKVPFSTANFIATDDLDPCKGIEGMKAKVEYTDVSDDRVAGQIVSIELSK